MVFKSNPRGYQGSEPFAYGAMNPQSFAGGQQVPWANQGTFGMGGTMMPSQGYPTTSGPLTGGMPANSAPFGQHLNAPSNVGQMSPYPYQTGQMPQYSGQSGPSGAYSSKGYMPQSMGQMGQMGQMPASPSSAGPMTPFQGQLGQQPAGYPANPQMPGYPTPFNQAPASFSSMGQRQQNPNPMISELFPGSQGMGPIQNLPNQLGQQPTSTGQMPKSQGQMTQQPSYMGQMPKSQGQMTQQHPSTGQMPKSQGQMTQQHPSIGQMPKSQGQMTQQPSYMGQMPKSPGSMTQQPSYTGQMPNSQGQMTQQPSYMGQMPNPQGQMTQQPYREQPAGGAQNHFNQLEKKAFPQSLEMSPSPTAYTEPNHASPRQAEWSSLNDPYNKVETQTQGPLTDSHETYNNRSYSPYANKEIRNDPPYLPYS